MKTVDERYGLKLNRNMTGGGCVILNNYALQFSALLYFLARLMTAPKMFLMLPETTLFSCRYVALDI